MEAERNNASQALGRVASIQLKLLFVVNIILDSVPVSYNREDTKTVVQLSVLFQGEDL